MKYTEQKEIEDIQYITFLLMARAGLRALEFYDPATQKHGQAHMQARYGRLSTYVCFTCLYIDMRHWLGLVSLSTLSIQVLPALRRFGMRKALWKTSTFG